MFKRKVKRELTVGEKLAKLMGKVVNKSRVVESVVFNGVTVIKKEENRLLGICGGKLVSLKYCELPGGGDNVMFCDYDIVTIGDKALLEIMNKILFYRVNGYNKEEEKAAEEILKSAA